MKDRIIVSRLFFYCLNNSLEDYLTVFTLDELSIKLSILNDSQNSESALLSCVLCSLRCKNY